MKNSVEITASNHTTHDARRGQLDRVQVPAGQVIERDEKMLSICVIDENPARLSTPFMKDVLHILGKKHAIRLMIVPVMPGIETTARALEEPLADVYLLKSHVPRAMEVARQLEERGALMVNTWKATLACQDRVESAAQLKQLALYWSREPVIVQECLVGDGWDTKVWVIDGQLFAAKRRSPLDDKPGDQFQIDLEELG